MAGMTKKPERYLTPDEDALFDLHVHAWADKLGLHDWDFYRAEGKPKAAMADIKPNFKAKYGGYRTGNWTHIPVSAEAIEKIALHEVLHVFLAELVLTQESDDTDWQIGAEHRVINVLVKLLTKEA